MEARYSLSKSTDTKLTLLHLLDGAAEVDQLIILTMIFLLVILRKSHLRKSYLEGLSEVGLPESIRHQEVPPQLSFDAADALMLLTASYLISSKRLLSENIAHVGYFSVFVFVFF